MLEEFLRRLKPLESDEVLYRALSFGLETKFADLVKCIEEDNGYIYTPKPGKPGDCFSSSPNNAEFFANRKDYQIVLKVLRHYSGRDIRPFYRAVDAPKQNIERPIRVEAEVVFFAGTRFKVLHKEVQHFRDRGMRITYTVEEIPPSGE